MYSQGQDSYLQDLDCVNIVKSIRELKALAKVILSQQQREILAFENQSILPRSKATIAEEENLISNCVPFEHSGFFKTEEYNDKVKQLTQKLSSSPLSSLDVRVIEEVIQETSNLENKTDTMQGLVKPDSLTKVVNFYPTDC